MRNFKILNLGLVAAAAVALFTLGTSSAMAGPIATVDGVSLPTGTNLGGYDFSTQTAYENLVTSAGQENYGIGTVDLIQENGTPTNTYTYGENGVYLNFVFSGFTAACVNSAGCLGSVDFKGGTISFYADSSALSTSGTFASVESAVTTGGSEFLGLTAEQQDSLGDTIIANLGGGSTTGFSDAGSTGFFAVSGGDAASLIAADGFANPATASGFAAVNFTSDDSVACGTNALSSNVSGNVCGDAGLETYVSGSGSARFNTNTVPEPASLALFGAGLLLLGGLVRRRKGHSGHTDA